MEKIVQSVISASSFEASVAARLQADTLARPLCVDIGAAEMRRHNGQDAALVRCNQDVLADLILSLIWEQVPAARALVTQIDAALSRRATCS